MNNRFLCSLCIFFLFLLQSSCILLRKAGHKPVISNDTTAALTPFVDTAKTDTAIAKLNEEKNNLIAALTPVWQQDGNFSTFTGKAKMHYESRDQKQEFTTIFRIRKNEAIWASVIALGGIVQVARVYITPDSFKLINYLDKEVTMMQLSDASKILPAPADFQTLQNLVIGHVLRTSGQATDAVDLGNILSLQVEEENFVQQINYNKADTTIQTLQMRSTVTGGPSGMISFNGYQTLNAKKFPTNRVINVVNGGEQYRLEMNFNKAEFDQPVDFPFSIPKNYKIK